MTERDDIFEGYGDYDDFDPDPWEDDYFYDDDYFIDDEPDDREDDASW